MTKTVIYLNRWGMMFHLMLGGIYGDTHRRLRSRFCNNCSASAELGN